MQKRKKLREKILLPLTLTSMLFFGHGCTALPKYKEYEQPKKVILHGASPFFDAHKIAVMPTLREAAEKDYSHRLLVSDSVASVLGEAQENSRKFYKFDIYGKEFWTEGDKNLHDINDENTISFLARNEFERIPHEITAYIGARHNSEEFRECLRDASKRLEDRKLPVNLSRIASRDYVKWISDYLVQSFRSIKHQDHKENYNPLIAVATEQSFSVLVSDAIAHRQFKDFLPDGDVTPHDGIRHATAVYRAMPDSSQRSRLENFLATVVADSNEHCSRRVTALQSIPKYRKELEESSTYACSKCYDFCLPLNQKALSRLGANWYSGPAETQHCKEQGYPCLCLAQRAR